MLDGLILVEPFKAAPPGIAGFCCGLWSITARIAFLQQTGGEVWLALTNAPDTWQSWQYDGRVASSASTVALTATAPTIATLSCRGCVSAAVLA